MKALRWILIPIAAISLALSPLLFVHPCRVEGRSMEPTFRSGQGVFVLRSWVAGAPKRGQVWMVEGPDGPSIKRVIALPGENLLLRSGKLALKDTFLNESWATVSEAGNGGPWDAGQGFLLLGDNRPQSRDSRAWGPLPQSAFRGRVLDGKR